MPEVRVWGPHAARVRVVIEPERARTETAGSTGSSAVTSDLEPAGDGWWRADVAEALPGGDYGFLLDEDEQVLPDPRSRRQPRGVHSLSRFYADDFTWTDAGWPGHGLPDSVIYELHIGTFTTAGTFDAAIQRLDHLVGLGVTHVEILPVNDFNGEWNWGYDGVLWFAVHEAYGGPDGLKRFVDACHGAGLAVVLDVVYNHLGASGNYLTRFGPYLKTGRSTWGDLVNLDGESAGPVREYILDNALTWLSEFHVDALRLDAVHALHDSSDVHLLAELSNRVGALSAELGRPLVLIAESDLNDPIMVIDRARGGYGLDGQWDDDVHHALHTLLSGERQGYYSDFGSLSVLAKVLTRAFVHDGTFSSFRGRHHGKPVDTERTPGYRFVVCLQNHDQVGNRAAGDRLPRITSPGMLKVGATLLLTSPFTPMLWMGEEWAASTPWPFFTSHPEPEMAEATHRGRIEEFADHGWDVGDVVNPQDTAAFTNAKLRWSERDEAVHSEILALYRRLLRLRRDHPDLTDPRLDEVGVDFDENAQWVIVHRGGFDVMANLADHAQALPSASGDVIFGTEPGLHVEGLALTLPARSACVLQILTSTQAPG
ncbi:MAG: malto-oligosyltrehalose trehalohydrolase [Actinomycetota bacterium]